MAGSRSEFLRSIWIFTIVVIILHQNEAAGPGLQVVEEKSLFEDVIISTAPNQPRYVLDHDYRLPEGLIPEHYVVNLRPILDEPVAGEDWEVDTCPGTVKMFVQCSKDMNSVIFHSNNIMIDYSSIVIRNEASGSEHRVIANSTNPDYQTITLSLQAAQPLKAGQRYSILVKFISKIPRSLLGMYFRRYMTPEGVEKKIVLTKLEAIGARMVFPCFDEPALKATYQINIAHNANYKTLCNMEIEEQIPDPDYLNWTWDSYFNTVKMSTYLIAFVVSEFNEVKATTGIYDRNVSTWAAPHHIENGGAEFAADETARVLQYFTELYDLEYPLEMKMDSAAIPEFSSGAMEQWGLITYRDDYLLYFPGVSTEADKFLISRIIAHEVSHQWFGNIVTLEWWDNLWLNEGFARYIEKVGVDHTHPEFDTNSYIVASVRISALNADAGITTKPVHYNGDNLSGIVYDKAGFLIRMMEAFLTKATLQKGLNKYLKKHLYGNARQDSLFEELTIAAHEDGKLDPSLTVKSIMDTWTHQTGFPLVRVGRVGNDRVYVSQERFGKTTPIINTPVLNPIDLWAVPLSFASTKNADFSPPNQVPISWLDKTSTFGIFPLNSSETDWIILNVDASAYFRVLYDEHLTNTLKTQLERNATSISPSTRSQILDDHLKSAFERYISMKTALDFTKFLDQEDTYVVWQTFFSNFRPSFILLNGHSKHGSEFKEYITDKLTGGLNKIGVKQLPEHKGANVLLRVQLLDWACSLGLEVCTDYAKELFQQWNATPAVNPVPVDIRAVMYCAMVWSGGKPSLDFMLNLYRNETVKLWPYNVKPLYRNAIACVSEDTVIDELLDIIFTENSSIPKDEAGEILARLAANSAARPKLSAFLTTNLIRVITSQGLNSVERIVTAEVAHWSEIEQLDQLQTFINNYPVQLGPILLALNRAASTIETNFKWMINFGNDMGDWFAAENDKDEEPTTPGNPGISTQDPGNTPNPVITTTDPGNTPNPVITTTDPGNTPNPVITTADPGNTSNPGVTTADPGNTPNPGGTTVDPGTTPDPGLTTENPNSSGLRKVPNSIFAILLPVFFLNF